MATSIRECGVDAEIRDLLPAHSWQESAELGASVERFGYLAPIIAWRNPAGELIVLDGHKRRELWLAACGAVQQTGGSIPAAPQVMELPFDSRDAAMLFVLDNATGRRNLSDLDRIKLAAKREEIVRRMARENLKTSSGGANPRPLAQAPKAETKPIDTRAECAKSAGVGEHTYSAGKAILDAVAVGALRLPTSH